MPEHPQTGLKFSLSDSMTIERRYPSSGRLAATSTICGARFPEREQTPTPHCELIGTRYAAAVTMTLQEPGGSLALSVCPCIAIDLIGCGATLFGSSFVLTALKLGFETCSAVTMLRSGPNPRKTTSRSISSRRCRFKA